MNSPIQVFISYASRDEGTALEFRKRLQKANILSFCAANDLKAGDDWQESIRNAITQCSEIILLVDPESVQSDWVLLEVGAGWALGKRITPILIRGSVDLLPDALKRLHCVSVRTNRDWANLIPQIVERLKSTQTASQQRSIGKVTSDGADEGYRSSEAAPTIGLPQEVKSAVSKKLQDTWDRYIEAIHRFIALNLIVIAGIAALVLFVTIQHKTPSGTVVLTAKGPLVWGAVFLVVCFLLLVIIRIWVQQFMDYEVMQPREDVEKYFQGRIHYSQSYRLEEWSYRWQYFTVRVITVLAPLTFLVGLSLSLLFLYRNLQ
jgi:hypothetical protein